MFKRVIEAVKEQFSSPSVFDEIEQGRVKLQAMMNDAIENEDVEAMEEVSRLYGELKDMVDSL